MSNGSYQKISHIPGNKGLPFLGHLLSLLTNPVEFAKIRAERYGLVSRFRILGRNSVLLLGPDANEFVTMDKGKVFSSNAAYAPFLGVLFPGTLGLMDFDNHSRQRRILQDVFKKDALNDYVELINDNLEIMLAKWEQQVDSPRDMLFQPEIKHLLLGQAAELFIGESLGDTADRVNQAFVDLVCGAGAVLRLPIPGTVYGKALVGRKYLLAFLHEHLIKKRISTGKDMLSHLITAKNEDGEVLDDQQVIEHMLGMLSAAHDTNTSVLTAVAYAMIRYPEIQDKMREEVRGINKDRLDYEDLASLTYCGQVFNEALRMWGPAHTLPRSSIGKCEYNGIHIPANTMVYISQSYTHRMKEYWTNPDQFDPDRFSADRAEHKQHRHLFMPFGGGAHKCIGMRVAEMQAKLFLFHLLNKFELKACRDDYEWQLKYAPLGEPKDYLPLKLRLLRD